MADYFQELLNNALAPAPADPNGPAAPVADFSQIQSGNAFSLGQAKQNELMAAADAKKAELGGKPESSSGMGEIPDMYAIATGMGNQSGARTMGELETDLRTLDPIQVRLKYGNAADDLLRSQADANAAVLNDRTATRSSGAAAYDLTSGVVSGAAQGLASLGSMGLGLIDADWGTTTAGWISDASDWVEGTQSNAVNAARRAQRAQSMLDKRDNEAIRKAEIAAGDPEWVAEFRRWGRDAIDAVGNSTDPTMFAQGTAEAVGSLLGGGWVAKGIRGLGAIGRTTLGRAGIEVGETAARRAGYAAWPLAIAGQEAGGAYQGTATQILAMPFSELEKNSAPFREAKAALLAQGLTEQQANEQARIAVANSGGLTAAAIQAPIAGVTGLLTRAFERPFQVPSIGSAARNVFVNEPLEEFIQSTTGQISQNIGVQRFADETQSLSEDVGEASVQGALYGMGAAGVVQAPGVAARATYQGGKLAYSGTKAVVDRAVEAGRPLYNALVERGERLYRQAEKAGTVGADAVRAASADLTTRAAQTAEVLRQAVDTSEAAPAQKAEEAAYVESLIRSTVLDPADEVLSQLDEGERAAIGDTTDRVEAIQRLAEHVTKQESGSKEQLMAVADLKDLMEPLTNLARPDLSILEGLEGDSEARQVMKQYSWLLNNINNTPEVRRAMDSLDALMKGSAIQDVAQDIMDVTINTPEGQRSAKALVSVAESRPDALPAPVIQKLLKHASSGSLNLSPNQTAALNASLSLLNARAEMDRVAGELNLRPMDVVGRQVVSANDPLNKSPNLKKSARQHTEEIISLLKNGNVDEAAAQLQDFGLFVQHMQNKVGALNESVGAGQAAGPKVRYEALSPTADRAWYQDQRGLDVDMNKAGSIRFAQTVGLEAKTVADVYNGLVNAFPQLGQAEIAPVQLDQRLNRNADELSREVRAGQIPAQPQAEPAPAEQENVVDGGIPTMITQAMRKELRELGVTEEEIRQMTPADAHARIRAPKPESKAAPVKSRITEEQAARLSDAGLNARIEAIQDKKEKTDEDQATFAVLDAEMTKREDAAVAAQEAEKQAEAPAEPVSQVSQVEQDAPAQEDNNPAVSEAYPGLITSIRNFFRETFRLPNTEQAPTRTMLDVDGRAPVEVVRDSLGSAAALEEHIGKKPKRNLTVEIADAYQDLLADPANADRKLAEKRRLEAKKNRTKEDNRRLSNLANELGNIGGIMAVMRANLSAFLSRDAIQQYLDTGSKEAQRLVNGKALNIVNEDFTYNEGLLQNAALASVQWMLTARQSETIMDEQDVEALTGIKADELSTDVANAIEQGMSVEQAKSLLANKILKFWGVRADRTADMAYGEGIPEAVAAEAMRAMVELGMLSETRIRLTEADGLPAREDGKANVKDIVRILVEIPPEAAVNGYPTAIEDSVLVEPEEVRYIGGDMPPVAARQMNNPSVENTKKQRRALGNEGKTPFKLNLPMVHLYSALGRQGMQTIFGGGSTENRPMNKNFAKSLEGKNRNVAASLDEIFATMEEMANAASLTGENLSDMEIRYAYNMSRVGRMQMLGKYNPQSNKQMREAILPTWSTLDLANNEAHQRAYNMALAQAMGISVHKLGAQESATQVAALLSGPLAPAVELMRDWMGEVDLASEPSREATSFISATDLKRIFDDAGVALTAVALHGLMDYARKESSDDLTNFRTALYLEADGVTNGPINAMVMMTIGNFTGNWLTNVRKGGLSFGPRQALHEMAGTKVDLYQTSTENTAGYLQQMVNKVQRQKNRKYVMENVNALRAVMAESFGNDVSFDPESGELTLKRGIAKNPLTITIYGSGATGIAGKLTGMIMDSFYERLSDAAVRMKANGDLSVAEAMFPGENSQARFDLYMSSLNVLMDTELGYSRQKDEFFRSGSVGRATSPDPLEFTFSREQMKNIRSNMLHAFVNPMRSGIADTVGLGLTEAATRIRKATQVQSIFLQYAYRAEINRVLNEKRAAEENRPGADFISRADLEEIDKRMQERFPLVNTGDQVFQIAKTRALGSDTFQYGRAFNDAFRTDASVFVPSNAGVAGIPFMTIGMGDGKMMQDLALDTSIAGTLKIFDGMNMPLDKIAEYGEKANRAAYNAWMGNPLQAVYDSFSKFIADPNLYENFTDEMGEDLVSALREEVEGVDFEKTSIRDVLPNLLEGLSRKMRLGALSVEARHATIQEMAVSVDQMAAVEAPFFTGSAEMAPLPDQTILNNLRTIYQNKYDALVKESEKEIPAALNRNEQTTPEPQKDSPFQKVGRADSSGARVLSWTAVKNVVRDLGLTDGQRIVFDQIMRARGTMGYKVVVGTAEQIAAYQSERGQEGLESDGATVHGYVSVSDRTIFLVNPTAETLVHELVHAGSYETILAHYQGKSLGENATTVREAIERMEKLMADFMSMEVDPLAPIEVQEAIADAQAAIQEGLNEVSLDEAAGKAKALNEFMAWGLSNAALAETLKGRKIPSLVQMAKDIIKAIKALIWGKKVAPKVADDVLSNLQFNAGVVIRTQPSLASMFANATMAHAARSQNERLTRVRDLFENLIVQHLEQRESAEPAAAQKEILEANLYKTRAEEFALKAAAAFSLNQEETTTLSSVVAALGTEARIDPNVLSRIQELYRHVTTNMKVDDFMKGDMANPDVDSHYAQAQFNLVLGRGERITDPHGRTSLMATFLGLAMVSNDFRAILEKIEAPKSIRVKGDTLDDALQNIANDTLEALSARLAGEGNAKNVRAALDALTEQLYENAVAEQSILEQSADYITDTTQSVNDWISSLMGTASEKGVDLGKKIHGKSGNKARELAGNFVRFVSSLASEKETAKLSEGILATLSRTSDSNALMHLAQDLIGRTAETGAVYDMIKRVRAAVQQLRQQFREKVPQIINSKFKEGPSKEQWATMFRAIGKTDLAAMGDMSKADLFKVFTDAKHLDSLIADLEASVREADTKHAPLLLKKAQQLAKYMNTGKPGANLLRNAYALANLWNEPSAAGRGPADASLIQSIDQLVTLYAVKGLSKADRDSMASLVQSEADGLGFLYDYMRGQRKSELAKARSGVTLANHYKGYLPSEQQSGVHLVVEEDTKQIDLRNMGYIRIGTYQGSSVFNRDSSKGYYFNTAPGRAPFAQGIMQNAKHTASGVDASTGFSTGLTAGRIHSKVLVQKLARQMGKERQEVENLMPVFDENGNVIAIEQSVDPRELARLNRSEQLHEMVGVWRGRQVEEKLASMVNNQLIDNLKAQYDTMLKENPTDKDLYVNLFSSNLDRVQSDAVSLMSDETRAYVEQVFGEGRFMVRKDQIDDVIGYRQASVSDFWTDNNRFSKETNEEIRKALVGAFGVDIYRKLIRAEQIIQGGVSDIRTLIVVKSVIVPVANFVSNMYQLVSRGVSPVMIGKAMPAKLAEINTYVKTRLRQIELEAELRAAGDNAGREARLRAEIRSITDAHKRLSIWPLIQAGEFSTIADVGLSADDLALSSGHIGSWIEAKVNQLPDGLRTAARYGLITRDTALFQGLQRSVQYGDFLAKAVMYDHLTQKKKSSKEEALRRITEEFVNYERLPGRTRGYLENMGLLWFYNFKLRIAKVALNTIQNNPLHMLLALGLPNVSGVGLPVEDNVISKLFQGNLGYTMGPWMAFRAPFLNPWYNLVN